MDMRVLGVPVVDTHPVEPGIEILFHLADQIAGEGFEVRHLHRVVGRDDEPEVMPVLFTALREGPAVHIVAARPEQPGLLSVTGHALTAEIIEMGGERR